jgi:hypothetical protein
MRNLHLRLQKQNHCAKSFHPSLSHRLNSMPALGDIAVSELLKVMCDAVLSNGSTSTIAKVMETAQAQLGYPLSDQEAHKDQLRGVALCALATMYPRVAAPTDVHPLLSMPEFDKEFAFSAAAAAEHHVAAPAASTASSRRPRAATPAKPRAPAPPPEEEEEETSEEYVAPRLSLRQRALAARQSEASASRASASAAASAASRSRKRDRPLQPEERCQVLESRLAEANVEYDESELPEDPRSRSTALAALCVENDLPKIISKAERMEFLESEYKPR